mmetsp:Transcript_11931/g.27041  ORF Transcript_11931/g.27041 Transcript_11931/m.27041 type:complete len:199 (-) Transcript_11931:266-862(-)
MDLVVAARAGRRRPLLGVVVAVVVPFFSDRDNHLFTVPRAAGAISTPMQLGTASARRAVSDDGFSPKESAAVKDFLLQSDSGKAAPAPADAPQQQRSVGGQQKSPEAFGQAAQRVGGLPPLQTESVGGGVSRDIENMDVEAKAVPALVAVAITLVVLGAVTFGVLGGLKQAAKDRQALEAVESAPASAPLIVSGSARR